MEPSRWDERGHAPYPAILNGSCAPLMREMSRVAGAGGACTRQVAGDTEGRSAVRRVRDDVEGGALVGGRGRVPRAQEFRCCSRTSAMSRPARSTVKSGAHQMRPQALPSASHVCRGRVGFRLEHLGTRGPVSAVRCWGVSGMPVTSTNPPRVASSYRVPDVIRALGHEPSVEGIAASASFDQ